LIFTKLGLCGEYALEPELCCDERGFFANSWNKKELKNKNLNSNILECNISFNKKKGTIRGLHFQKHPYEQVKIIRCTKGKIFDVALDLRKNSNTFLQSSALELSDTNHKLHYIPEGCAHGFQTLEDNSELFYQMSQFYFPKFSSGVKWDDPKFQIKWPLKPTVVSQKDKSWSIFKI
jgi:dTDP-4-dehydrorhamnose 3,5-epimerase